MSICGRVRVDRARKSTVERRQKMGKSRFLQRIIRDK